MTTAKAKPKRVRQKRIEGTEDGQMEGLRGEAEKYVELVRSRMKQQQRENVNREDLIKAMKAVGIDVVTLDDGSRVRLKHVEADDKLKIEKAGKDGDDD